VYNIVKQKKATPLSNLCCFPLFRAETKMNIQFSIYKEICTVKFEHMHSDKCIPHMFI